MSENFRKAVVFGATSAIAEHCLRHWCARGLNEVVLVGRDLSRLQRVEADLRVRFPQLLTCCIVGELQHRSEVTRVVDEAMSGAVADLVLIAQGTLPDQLGCQRDLSQLEAAVAINGMSPVLCAEAVAGYFEKTNRGTLVVIGSVAGDRARQSNYAYGASKGLVERYVEGLQHRFARSAVRVILAKPGPTATPMTALLQAAGARLAPVERVATLIVSGVDRGHEVVYAPRRWRWIMLMIRMLPRVIFNRLRI